MLCVAACAISISMAVYERLRLNICCGVDHVHANMQTCARDSILKPTSSSTPRYTIYSRLHSPYPIKTKDISRMEGRCGTDTYHAPSHIWRPCAIQQAHHFAIHLDSSLSLALLPSS